MKPIPRLLSDRLRRAARPFLMCLLFSPILVGFSEGPLGAQEPRVGGELGLSVLHFDDFISSGDGKLDIWAQRVRGRLQIDAPAVREGFRTTLEVQQTHYEKFAPAAQVRWGVDLDLGTHSLESYLRLGFDRPVFFRGPDLVTAEELRGHARWGWRFLDDWESRVQAGWYEEEFEGFAPKDNDTWQAGLSLRYRGWGYRFSPELGVLWRFQDARDPNYDYTQRDLVLQLRSLPHPDVYIKLRYRYRQRDYDTSDVADSNFARQDDRHQGRLQVYWDLNERFGLDLYAANESVDSLKPGSSRKTTTLATGLRIRF